MTIGNQPPHIEVAVALVRNGKKLLSVYNTKWGAFTLPITKRRRWSDPDPAVDRIHEEDWADAAGRAAAECLGCTVLISDEPLLVITDLEYSSRTGEWKHYRIHIFDLPFDKRPAVVNGQMFEWLTAKELLDPIRRSISPTAREVLRQLRANQKIG